MFGKNQSWLARQMRIWWLSLLIAFFGNGVLAQIVPDNTLGAESSAVVPIEPLVEQIEGGAIRGSNLFHSFLEFNVGEGSAAYFLSPNSNILNILARVTGNNRSEILGILGTRGGSHPNLLLINPKGIIFGPNARLDVSGSFVASTANRLNLADGTQFTAKQPQTTPLLTISLPVGLQYGSNTGSIQVQGSQLEVQPGQTLALVGGNVSITSGRLGAAGGRIELGGVTGEGTVELGRNGNILNLNFPNGIQKADVLLTNRASANVLAGSGGDIAINAHNLEISAGSLLRAGIASGLGSPDTQAGNIQINATGAITIANESGITNAVLPKAVGEGGNIDITTGSLSGTNGAQIAAVTLGQGKAGNVTIIARDTVSFDGVSANGFSSGVFSPVEPKGQGNGGNINITARSLSLTNGAFLTANTLGQGNAGSVTINAYEGVSFDGVGSNGPSGVFSQVWEGAVGKGGDINITTGSLSLTNGALISSSTFGRGDGGSIRVQARDGVVFAGVGSTPFPILGRTEFASGALSMVGEQAVGSAGYIDIIAGSLVVTNGALVSSSTFGQGGAGSIRVQARDEVVFDGVGSGAFSTFGNKAVGNGGNIDIIAGSLVVKNKAELNTNTLGQGNAGNVNVDVREAITFAGRGTGVFSNVLEQAVGKGGQINLATGSLYLTDNAELVASTWGRGDAGGVTIRARDAVVFDGVFSGVFTVVSEGAVGNGGGIDITTGSLSLTNGAELSSSSFGQGNAGRIKIDARDTVSFDGMASNGRASGIFSRLEGFGDGGNIEILAESLFLTNGAQVTSSTFGQGDAGTVRIDVRDTFSLDGKSSNGLTSGVYSQVAQKAMGNGGSIFIDAQTLMIQDGAAIVVNGSGTGRAGSLTINAPQFSISDGASISASNRDGQGGNITAIANNFTASNGGQILTTTSGGAQAGSITLKVADNLTVTGNNSGLFANTELGSTGDGGNIFLDSEAVLVHDGAGIGVNSEGKGRGGSIQLITGTLTLEDNALISAETFSTNGGEISLDVQGLLLLRHGSKISATAGTASAGGNGGNINVNGRFLVAVPLENSDIFANAFEGRGGKINITTQGLFGLKFRDRPTPLSDITASSEFGLQGVVQLNIPEVDPSQGLVELPTNPIDAASLIAQNFCRLGQESQFVVTGRGGLPASPNATLNPDAPWVDLRLEEEQEQPREAAPLPQSNHRPSTRDNQPKRIIEAQAWAIAPNGSIILTAEPIAVTPQGIWLHPTDCHILGISNK